jgi:drug/metabolite transporter (DMT)-like permease
MSHRFATLKDEENDLRIGNSGSMEDDYCALDSNNHNHHHPNSPRRRRNGVSAGGMSNSTTYQVIDGENFDDNVSPFNSKHHPPQPPQQQQQQQVSSILLLNIVAIIWGSQHAIIKMIVQDNDVAAFTFVRFGLASVIALPYLPGLQEAFAVFGSPKNDKTMTIADINDHLKISPSSADSKNEIAKAWRWGTELGFWMFLDFSLQAIGLLSTSAQRSGFLLYLNVKFVPFFAFVLLGRQISNGTWLSAIAAFSGTALLALDGQSSIGLNVGDVWSILAAMASAMFILRLETATLQVPKSSQLNAASLLVVATLSGCWLLGQSVMSAESATAATANLSATWAELKNTIGSHPLELLYLGAVSTALSNFLQAKAQKDVPAERASIVYSLDPVYGALFSYLLLGETLGGVQSYLGAAMIFVAAATNSLLEFSKKQDKVSSNEIE